MKVEQLKNYINYRLQHIENLVKPISDLIGDGTLTGKIHDLETMRTMANRLAGYLGELIKWCRPLQI